MSGVVALIFARGGSKGIPRKNIRDLGGKPLIAYSIEAALHTKSIDHVIVSTDDEEIARVAREYGAEVPFPRPKHLAGDKASLAHAYEYTVRKLMELGYRVDYTVMLYPTHPFRTPQLLEALVGKMLAGYSPVLTIRPVDCRADALYHAHGDNNSGLTEYEIRSKTGSGFRVTTGLFVGAQYNYAQRPYVHLVDDPVSNIDIDEEFDFKLAEEVVRSGLFSFKDYETRATDPGDGPGQTATASL